MQYFDSTLANTPEVDPEKASKLYADWQKELSGVFGNPRFAGSQSLVWLNGSTVIKLFCLREKWWWSQKMVADDPHPAPTAKIHSLYTICSTKVADWDGPERVIRGVMIQERLQPNRVTDMQNYGSPNCPPPEVWTTPWGRYRQVDPGYRNHMGGKWIDTGLLKFIPSPTGQRHLEALKQCQLLRKVIQ